MNLGDFMRARARSGRWADRDYAVRADLDELHAEAEARTAGVVDFGAAPKPTRPPPQKANLGLFLRGEIAYKRAIRREEHAAEAARAEPAK